MTHYFATSCPGCLRPLRVRTAYFGQEIRCNRCDHAFVAGPAGDGDLATPAASKLEPMGDEDAAGEDSSGPRIADLEEQVQSLSADLAARSEEAAAEAERRRRAEARSAEASAQIRALEDALDVARAQSATDAVTLGGLVAERDRLRDEAGDLQARLESALAEAGHRAGESLAAGRERERLELLCRQQDRQMERGGVELAAMRAALEAADGRHRAALGELAEARERWDTERRLLIDGAERSAAQRTEVEARLREAEGRLAATEEDAETRHRAIGALRLDLEAARREVARIGREREGLEHSLRIAVAEGEEARRQRDARAGLAEALAQAERLRDEAAMAREAMAERLQKARDQHDQDGRKLEAERQKHRLAVETLREESEAERRALVARSEEARRLRDEEANGEREARRDLLGQLDSACRERDALRTRLAEIEAEARSSTEPGAGPPGIEPPVEPVLLPAVRGPAAAGHAARGEVPAHWPVPDVGDLEAARRQLALLLRLLKEAKQANSRLSARFAELMEADRMAPRPGAAERPGASGTPSRTMKEQDEVSWHLEVARRAARLARRRGSLDSY